MIFFLFGLIICFMEAVMAQFNPNNTQVYRVREDFNKKNSKMNDIGHLFFRPPYPMALWR